jgi:hypothetical protein
VNAAVAVFMGDDNLPKAASAENPLPVTGLSNGFTLPPHNDVAIQYANTSFPTKPTYMTFRLNGTEVFWLQFTYDGAGNLTRIQPD